MTMVCRLSSRLMLLVLVALLGLAAACDRDSSSDNDSESDISDTVASDNGTTTIESEDAPDPISVSANEIEVVDEWEEAGVPAFRDGEVLDFEPHASRIENGGTVLLDGDGASSEDVIGFYRGALAELGWQERRVGAGEMTAESDVASLLVTVTVHEEQTLIMMILTDRLGD
jgi:hypothetical protein